MIDERKQDHLDICTQEKVEAGSTGLSDVRLEYRALPEIDFDRIDTRLSFLGRKLKYPIIINAMTGGTGNSTRINRDIAEVAQEYGLGLGVGSQRAAVDNPRLEETFKVRESAPDLPLLIANLGAVQLNYGYGVNECRKAVDMIGADALALHINPLQEALQPEGNRNFSGLAGKINSVALKMRKQKIPVIAKCVGEGITYETARKLKVDAIDVSGVGGTCWSLVEGYRSEGASRRAAMDFAGFGVPTADAIREVARLKKPLIGSGGIRTGIDAAKAIALGADVVGVSLPVLKAWSAGSRDGVRGFLDSFTFELKVAMFLAGAADVRSLRGRIVG
ncbi:MAG: type 2 isopentenyl-diphosphate Delta-isomerase [Candidatus Altiarchaeota archaeon]|nr:type 2 isopentenyl-diphosphate Delta-isomerase [Candidatus Altiarchaeota archaeon]